MSTAGGIVTIIGISVVVVMPIISTALNSKKQGADY